MYRGDISLFRFSLFHLYTDRTSVSIISTLSILYHSHTGTFHNPNSDCSVNKVFHRYLDTNADTDTILKIHTKTNTDTLPKIHTNTKNKNQTNYDIRK